ncbi:MAG TPA: (2Fe-2S)-binding protein [Acetobacteraceae bacterium]|jgi:predicted molibdopterin-dependent oxidoreductase YjgC|nr:(2Fe-2S)-binding protein [Acetobacteraceae bacterium]
MLTRPEKPVLAETGALTVYFDGRPIAARAGDSVAAALLAGGIAVTRQTPVTGAARGPYCMMGACFDCLAVVDGRPSVQTCMTQVRDGMRVERQDGARGLAIEASDERFDPSAQPPPSRGGGE